MNDTFKCPECEGTISQEHYDSAFEMYECPSCEGMFTFDELLEQSGSSNGVSAATSAPKKPVPVAKAKKRRTEILSDEEAGEAQIESMIKGATKQPKEERHQDEINTGMVLNIMADEIESICEELGISMTRLNAREFYAMNLYRPLIIKGVRAREQDVPHVLCKEHE